MVPQFGGFSEVMGDEIRASSISSPRPGPRRRSTEDEDEGMKEGRRCWGNVVHSQGVRKQDALEWRKCALCISFQIVWEKDLWTA